ncbi:hypothetical protein [uncultured Ruminococcus sp.]|uniref:hypothetical protein n=1 Tax=uncultured Ruminococcus sp. TaxID=165186 RepID=UPI002613171C|nr:hypothetical protein [uncultured Ruminococcus sp.]
MTSPEELYRNRNVRSMEFAKNLSLLNRCKKRYSFMGIVYIVPMFMYFIVTLIYGMLTGSFSAFLVAIFECPLLAFLAYKSFYHQKDLAAMLIIAILLLVQGLLHVLSKYEPEGVLNFGIAGKCFWIHLVFALIVGGMAALNLTTNFTYHKLEEADGFPHFNERFFEQEMDRQQFGIKNPFQQEMERRMKTASDSMSDIGMSGKSMEKYTEVHKPSEMEEL